MKKIADLTPLIASLTYAIDEQNEARLNRARRKLNNSRPGANEEANALRDMLYDISSELASVRTALGVSYEPHQSIKERTLLAAAQPGAHFMAEAARPLREQGERERTYELQDAFNRAAEIVERMGK